MNKALIIFCFVVNGVCCVFGALNTQAIEDVRAKYESTTTALPAEAVTVLDEFWRSTLDTMILSRDSEEVVSIRRELVKQKGTKNIGFYRSAYMQAGKSDLVTAFSSTEKNSDIEQKTQIERNLMILVAELKGLELAEFALPRTANPDPVVRYWAVRALTDTAIAEQLRSDIASDADRELGKKIVAAMTDYVKNFGEPQMLVFIANFALTFKTPESLTLLNQAADTRIVQYMNWTVRMESTDVFILKNLNQAAAENPSFKAESGRRFGQLYACVIQRYIKGTIKAQPILSEDSKSQVISVIAEIEDAILSKTITGWQKTLRNDLAGSKDLTKSYEILFGTTGRAGDLTTQMGIDYGTDASGKKLVNPLPLPQPKSAAAPAALPAPAAPKPAAETKAAPVAPATPITPVAP